MSEFRIRAPLVRSARSAEPARSFERAEDCVWPMPTVDEVVRAGYPAAYWDSVKRERDEFIARFNSDPAFREDARRKARERL